MNGTHVLIILGGFVDVEKYRYIYFVFFLTVYILIISCNCTIIWLIWIHRNLHEPMYFFIAALSLNSLFYSTAFYPKLIVDVLSHQQSISHAACMFQMFCFYTLAASDFFLLAAMAYDRYVSICKPLQYATIMSASNVAILLAVAWLLPGIKVGLAVYFNTKIKMCKFVSGGIFCNNSVNKLQCMKPQILTIYTVFVFINCEILPVLFILYTYIKIFIISYRRCGRAWKKAAETCLPHLMVLICFSCLVMFDVVVDKLESDLPKTTRLIMMLQIVMYNPLFNPIIYGLKMKQIWRHIKMLFGSRSKSNPARPAR